LPHEAYFKRDAVVPSVVEYLTDSYDKDVESGLSLLYAQKQKIYNSMNVDENRSLSFRENVRRALPPLVPYKTADDVQYVYNCHKMCMFASRLRTLRFMGNRQYTSVESLFQEFEALDIINLVYNYGLEVVVVENNKIDLRNLLNNSGVVVFTVAEFSTFTIYDRDWSKILWWRTKAHKKFVTADYESVFSERERGCRYLPSLNIIDALHVRVSSEEVLRGPRFSRRVLLVRQHYLFQLAVRSFCATQSIYSSDTCLFYYLRPLIVYSSENASLHIRSFTFVVNGLLDRFCHYMFLKRNQRMFDVIRNKYKGLCLEYRIAKMPKNKDDERNRLMREFSIDWEDYQFLEPRMLPWRGTDS